MINPQLQVRGYVGLIHSPFSTVTPASAQYAFINSLDKANVMYGGEITYQPSKNMYLQIGFNRLPAAPQNQFYQPVFYRYPGY